MNDLSQAYEGGNVIAWGQSYLAAVLRPGDLAVDLTLGNGGDALFLWRQVAPGGRVIAFDLQEAALASSRKRLESEGVPVSDPNPRGPDRSGLGAPGVHLVRECHSRISHRLEKQSPRALVANLGYLPGGDRTLITRGDTTVAALSAGAICLEDGGRMAVVCYTGHPGGPEEAQMVENFFSGLSPGQWFTIRFSIPNRRGCPFLLMAEKRRR